MTIDEWKSIKDGQTIYNKQGRPRLVLRGCSSKSLCIALKPIRLTDTNASGSVYDVQCRSSFFLFPPEKSHHGNTWMPVLYAEYYGIFKRIATIYLL